MRDSDGVVVNVGLCDDEGELGELRVPLPDGVWVCEPVDDPVCVSEKACDGVSAAGGGGKGGVSE